MQQTHLTAWQTHAPWPKRSQIEQDLRLSRGVAAIFTDEVLRSHLAMRGGTVLHKAHLAPAARYSEDIDLVLTKPMDTATLEKNLLRVFRLRSWHGFSHKSPLKARCRRDFFNSSRAVSFC